MRNRWRYFRPVCDYLGLLLWLVAPLLLVPLAARAVFAEAGRAEVAPRAFWLPAVLCAALGLLLKRNLRFPALDNRRAMILCALGWIVISAVGALPFWLGQGMSFLDAYFETVSGFTTTGITMLGGLDVLPRSVLFWRSCTRAARRTGCSAPRATRSSPAARRRAWRDRCGSSGRSTPCSPWGWCWP